MFCRVNNEFKVNSIHFKTFQISFKLYATSKSIKFGTNLYHIKLIVTKYNKISFEETCSRN